MKKRRVAGRSAMTAVFVVLFGLSLWANAALSAKVRRLDTQLMAERQREMADVVDAMADIEVNLEKLLLASGAAQSVQLLGETALLAQHVESGVARLPLSAQTSLGAMKFAGQMGDYVMTLAVRMSSGGMLTSQDEERIELLLSACQWLNAHLLSVDERLYREPMKQEDPYVQTALGWQDEAFGGEVEMGYPSLIYDGPFSDGRGTRAAQGLTGERVTREQARQAAARFAGTTPEHVHGGADSGGQLEAFGFLADTPDGRVSVQVTGQGGHLLWMMPEEAAFERRYSTEECLLRAQSWLEEMGYEQMERCFVQEYDGMVVANFAAVQCGVLIYPEQVKLQVSRETGRVVGAECSQYLMSRRIRGEPSARLTKEQAGEMLSGRLCVTSQRLCVIPRQDEERLCWEFRGTFSGETYYAYIDADTGEAAEILRIAHTQEGETAL